MGGNKSLNNGQPRDDEEITALRSNNIGSDGDHSESHELSDWVRPNTSNIEGEEGEEHERLLDPNFPDDDDLELHEMEPGRAASFDSEAAAKANEEDSPYEEVRAAVRNFDEDLPCSTIRAWTIGLSLTFVGAAVNTLFSLRAPSIGLGPLIAQIVAWVMGRMWERVVPQKQITLFGVKCELNPGPFSIKEHAIIVVMASVSFSVAYATDIILAQVVFYKQNFGILFQLLIVISTQSLGYGIAGIMRKFLVYPASMIWPSTLVAIALMNAMWFGLVTVVSCVYYFIPGFFAQFLSVTAIATWLAPQNPIVNQIFGGAWYSQFLPMSDPSTYDNTGALYNVSRVLTPDFTLDEKAYQSYSPLFISTTFALSYGLSFAAITALVVHTFLYYSGNLWAQYRNSTHERPDIHMKLMRKYKEAPSWWYTSLFLIVLALSLFAVLFYPTNLKWWAFLLAVAISFMFSLPIGIVAAVTSQEIGLNVLTEFIYGYIQPGRPLALMLFKTYGYITMSQALSFIADLKFGHYMKIPPRTMFMAQVVATTLSCFIQVAVLNYALANIDGVCEPTQPERFTCPGGRVFFSASIVWGLIGPVRVFSPGQIYSGLLIFFIIGAVTPVVIYLIAKRYPRSPAKYLMAPLIFGGAGNIPPATPLNYLSWGVVGYVFQFVIKKRHFRWWSRLNYLTSAGLDLGLAIGTIIIFLAFTLRGVGPPEWWGNRIVTSTMDYQGTAVQVVLPPGEKFGPKTW
ncbi:hypothetical protein GQX73_g1462 [Xylaria multiplex]|uniref:OPT family small oligopeptide transporter n=1 Tax=Xylaria multiplex TaxID=323545 RepID=A0A7C8MZQ9_9PEZI|nr:hypothetical protein GQX73_g1462 [Xylaria multiplex]